MLFLVCWLEISLGSMSKKYQEKHKKNILMDVQCERNKPNNSVEIGVVDKSTNKQTGRNLIDGLSIVSLDPRHIY